MGARHLVERHRELLDGVTEAIGEVGGFSYTLENGVRLTDPGRGEEQALADGPGPRRGRARLHAGRGQPDRPA